MGTISPDDIKQLNTFNPNLPQGRASVLLHVPHRPGDLPLPTQNSVSHVASFGLLGCAQGEGKVYVEPGLQVT